MICVASVVGGAISDVLFSERPVAAAWLRQMFDGKVV